MIRIFEFAHDTEAPRPPKGGDESARNFAHKIFHNFAQNLVKKFDSSFNPNTSKTACKVAFKIAGTLVSPFRGSGGYKVAGKLTLLLFIFLTTTLTLFSQNQIPDKKVDLNTFLSANQNFQNKNYDDAIRKYEIIVNSGLVSKEVYFNLGNSFFKKNKIGKAILNYERALLLKPNDSEVLHNLEIAKEKRLDEIEALPDFFLAKGWKNIRQLMSSGGWSFLGIITLWAGIGGLILWLLGKTRTHRKKGFAYGIGLLILSLLPFALSYSSYSYSQNNKNAIILNNQISLKSGADEASTEILKINEGTKVNIQEKVSNWYKVRLENGEVGWLLDSALEEI